MGAERRRLETRSSTRRIEIANSTRIAWILCLQCVIFEQAASLELACVHESAEGVAAALHADKPCTLVRYTGHGYASMQSVRCACCNAEPHFDLTIGTCSALDLFIRTAQLRATSALYEFMIN
jgi:hypothetical protein